MIPDLLNMILLDGLLGKSEIVRVESHSWAHRHIQTHIHSHTLTHTVTHTYTTSLSFYFVCNNPPNNPPNNPTTLSLLSFIHTFILTRRVHACVSMCECNMCFFHVCVCICMGVCRLVNVCVRVSLCRISRLCWNCIVLRSIEDHKLNHVPAELFSLMCPFSSFFYRTLQKNVTSSLRRQCALMLHLRWSRRSKINCFASFLQWNIAQR